ncbi:MAG: hypothetical protein ACI9E1_002263 [Cryomorphaceae bacterium]|jgi:hypothetical protein
MQKLQILFPEPMINKLRKVAKEEDLPVSEIIRRAADLWLKRFPDKPTNKKKIPTIDAGASMMSAEDMKEALYE